MSSNYLVSIVTPFHNTKMEFFQRGYESLKRQTVGFENIEWVVVVHNSEAYYADAVKELTKGSDNVKVYLLNNHSRTPSSPRNYALSKVTGKYVGFLDSDDYLTDDGLAEVVAAMEETGADIASFRAETEPEDDTVIQAIDTRARFDQTVHSVLYNKGDEGLNDLIYAGGLTIWGKLIRADFLNQYQTRFSEDLKYGEDVCFTMECLANAGKVVLLPQTIVYVYFMNHGSIAQDSNHTGESLLKLAHDFAHIFDVTIQGGFALEKLAWPVLGYLAEMMAATSDLSEDVKKQICGMMRKYFDVLGPLEPDAKFFNAQMAEHFMKRARMIILGEEDADELTKASLLPILLANADTDYGRKYGFGGIRSVQEYRDSVPLSDYRTYRPLVKLMTHIGETNLICAENVVAYSEKRCVDGGKLLIPQTATFLAAYQDRLMGEINAAGFSTLLLMESSGEEAKKRFQDGAYVCSIRETVLNRIRKSDIFCSHTRAAGNKYGTLTDPEEVIFRAGDADIRYARLLFALLDPDVSQIIAPFTVTLLDLMRYLECMWEYIVDDIARGTISEKSGLSQETRQELAKLVSADPARAKELQEAFEGGFEGVIPIIWKRMERIVAHGAGENAVYSRQLMRYTGKVPLNYGYLDSAEAIIGKAAGDNENTFVLLDQSTFFEFLPEGAADAKTLVSSELTEGNRYELVITNTAGLYRYRSGVIIEAFAVKAGRTVVRYCYNERNVLELNGVLLNTLVLRQAGKKIDAEAGLLTYDFSLSKDEMNRCFVLSLKPEKDGTYDAEKIADIAEKQLSEFSTSYAEGRRAGRVEKIKVAVFPAAESELERGVAPVPANMPHVLRK